MNSKKIAKKIIRKNEKIYEQSKIFSRIYCNILGPTHILPDYIIIGAAKSGTTSLYEYMIKNPRIEPAITKQIHYFDKYFSRGSNWYKTTFPKKSKKNKILKEFGEFQTGEATPMYMEHPLAPKRVHDLIPNVKLIVLLRNPVERAYSRYNMELKNNNENLTFEETIEQEPERLEGEFEKMKNDENYFSHSYDAHAYVTTGIYADQLERWFEYFPREQFLIIKSEDFFEQPNKIMNKVFDFLQISIFKQDKFEKFREGNYPSMKPETREKLVEFFKPHNKRLYELLGIDFGWDK